MNRRCRPAHLLKRWCGRAQRLGDEGAAHQALPVSVCVLVGPRSRGARARPSAALGRSSDPAAAAEAAIFALHFCQMLARAHDGNGLAANKTSCERAPQRPDHTALGFDRTTPRFVVLFWWLRLTATSEAMLPDGPGCSTAQATCCLSPGVTRCGCNQPKQEC